MLIERAGKDNRISSHGGWAIASRKNPAEEEVSLYIKIMANQLIIINFSVV